MFIDSKKEKLSLSIIGFREHKRTSTKVFDKVFLIKDILISNPHRAHIDILSDLDFENLKQKYNNGDNFKDTQQFYAALQKVLNLKELNKKFYQEIAYWFYYSLDKVKFPNDINAANHEQISLIRLLTRIIFIWFLKEKKTRTGGFIQS